MDTKEFYRVCGLTGLKRPRREAKWHRVKFSFIGAQHYVLRTEYIEAQFLTNGVGIALNTRKPLVFPAAMLLGPKCKVAKLYDVKVETEVITLSLASILPNEYPKVLRMDQEVSLL